MPNYRWETENIRIEFADPAYADVNCIEKRGGLQYTVTISTYDEESRDWVCIGRKKVRDYAGLPNLQYILDEIVGKDYDPAKTNHLGETNDHGIIRYDSYTERVTGYLCDDIYRLRRDDKWAKGYEEARQTRYRFIAGLTISSYQKRRCKKGTYVYVVEDDISAEKMKELKDCVDNFIAYCQVQGMPKQ